MSLDAVKYHLENVVTKLGIEGRARLKHWRGVPNDSALGRRKTAMATPLALGPIGQISRSVRNIEASIAWYRDKLGLRHLYTFGKLSFFDCGGTRLFLEERAEPTTESVLYLRVPDIRAAYDELQARGIAFNSAPHLIHRHDDGAHAGDHESSAAGGALTVYGRAVQLLLEAGKRTVLNQNSSIERITRLKASKSTGFET